MQIRRAAVDAIVDHARREQPLEGCGLLIGTGEAVLESRAARNLRASEVVYLVDPADHFDAIREARAAGLGVIGAYHSHPRSPAHPSATDIREANDPDFVHVIVSLAGPVPTIAAYRIRGEEAIEVPLTIESS